VSHARPDRDLKCDGFIPTPRGEAPYGVAQDLGADADGPDACFQHDKHIRRGGNQASSESCVWWGMAGGLWMLCGILDLPQQWLSVLAGYYWTRMRTHGGDRSKIYDGGCRTTDATEVVHEVGWCPDKDWPFVTYMKNEEPPMHAFLKATKRDWLRPRRVIAYGPEHARIIRQTLSAPGKAARPILRATRVNQTYLNWRPGDPAWRFRDPLKGRHLELVGNYDTAGIHRVSSWRDTYDRIESWDSVENDYTAESWVLDVDVKAFEAFVRRMAG